MTAPELLELFNARYEFIASQDAPGYTDDEILLLLNEAHYALIEKYYNAGPERNEDIQNKLGTLFQEFDNDLTNTNVSTIYNGKQAIAPFNSVGYILSEMVDTSNDIGVPVKSISHNQFNANKKNPFKKPFSDLCWRVKIDGSSVLICDDDSEVTRYYGAYLRIPSTITADASSQLNEFAQYELVDLAVKLAYDRAFRK